MELIATIVLVTLAVEMGVLIRLYWSTLTKEQRKKAKPTLQRSTVIFADSVPEAKKKKAIA